MRDNCNICQIRTIMLPIDPMQMLPLDFIGIMGACNSAGNATGNKHSQVSPHQCISWAPTTPSSANTTTTLKLF